MPFNFKVQNWFTIITRATKGLHGYVHYSLSYPILPYKVFKGQLLK